MEVTKQTQTGIAKKRPIDWVNTLFLTLTPLSALGLGVYVVATEGVTLFHGALFIAMYLITGFSITAGYHRLFSHKAYQAHPLIETVFLLFGAASFQNSALKWCSDHRRHHRYCDNNEKDPYSIGEGFFHAHIGWIFRQEDPEYANRFPKDLKNNPRVMWQHRHYLALCVLMGFGFPTLIGAFFGSALGGFVFGGLVRVVVVHHATFFINSLCHMVGTQPYTDSNSAKDSPFMAFFTYGEGYHNFHHYFQFDYRNGVRWYHFDPTKWLIWTLSKMGQAKNLKRVPRERILQAQLNMQHKRAQSTVPITYQEKLAALKEKLDESLVRLQRQKAEALKHMGESKRQKDRQIQQLKEELNQTLQEWSLVLSQAKVTT